MESSRDSLQKTLGANQLLRLLSSQSASTYANQGNAFVIPWLVLTRTGSAVSLGAGMGSIIIALAALFFGWLIHVTSAKTGLLASAIVMGLIALGVLLFPFMKHLDDKMELEAGA